MDISPKADAPEQDTVTGKSDWIKPELICLNSDTAEGKTNTTNVEVSVGSGLS